MKALNNREVNRSYFRFSGYLAACVLTGVIICFFHLRSREAEISRIIGKTVEYDNVYALQTGLTGDIDSLYRGMSLFNTNLNDAVLLTMVSNRKQELIASWQELSSADALFYRKLSGEINAFLAVKDSIRLLTQEEGLVREELRRCIDENKQMKKRVTIRGISSGQ